MDAQSVTGMRYMLEETVTRDSPKLYSQTHLELIVTLDINMLSHKVRFPSFAWISNKYRPCFVICLPVSLHLLWLNMWHGSLLQLEPLSENRKLNALKLLRLQRRTAPLLLLSCFSRGWLCASINTQPIRLPSLRILHKDTGGLPLPFPPEELPFL